MTGRWILPTLVAAMVAAAGLTACGSPTPAASVGAVLSTTAADPPSTAPTGTESDPSDITAALDAWPTAWADRDAAAVCGLFAQDVIFTFQGGPDRTYSQACTQFTSLLSAADKTISYLPPDIESIDVDGDLAAVRLIWTATITGADATAVETTREKGLDILRRQPDGTWRITVSYAFPLT